LIYVRSSGMKIKGPQARRMVGEQLAKTIGVFSHNLEIYPEQLTEHQIMFLFFTELSKVGPERNLVGLEAFFFRTLAIAKKDHDPQTIALAYGYLVALDVIRQSPDALKHTFDNAYDFLKNCSVESISVLQQAYHLISLVPQSHAALLRLYHALPTSVRPCLVLSVRAAVLFEINDFQQFFLCMKMLHDAQRCRGEDRQQALEYMVEGHFYCEKEEPDFKYALQMYKVAKNSRAITEPYYKILQVVCLVGLENTELAGHVLQQILEDLDKSKPSVFCCKVPYSGLLTLISMMVNLKMTTRLVDVVSLLVQHGRDCDDSLHIIRKRWDQPGDDPQWRDLLEQLAERNPCQPMLAFHCATEQKNQGDPDVAERTLARGCVANPKNILLHRERALLALDRDPRCSQATRSLLFEAMQLDQHGTRDLRRIYDAVLTKQRDVVQLYSGPAATINPPSFPKVQYWDQGEWHQGSFKGVSWSGQNVVEPTGFYAGGLSVWTSELRYLNGRPTYPGAFFDTTPIAWRKKLPFKVEEYISNRLTVGSTGFKPNDMLEHLRVESRGGILLVGGLLRDGISKEYKEKKFPKRYFDVPGDIDVVTTLQPETVEFFCRTFEFKDNEGHTVSPTISSHRNNRYYGATSCRDIDFLTVRRSGMFAPRQKVKGSYVPVFPLVFGNCGHDLLTDAQARPFCCDAIYYDISSRTAIDPTGYGVLDASTLELRVTSDLYLLKNPEYIWRYLVRRACGYWGSEETKEKMRRSALHFWGEAHRAEHPTQLRWYYQKYTKTSSSGRSLSGQQFVRILKDDGMGDLAAQVMQPLCDSA
jgi:hypothetical protein